MVLSEYDGDHFVCFIDISGFKVMMSAGVDKAKEALLSFYKNGYEALRNNYGVEGIFISDCAVLVAKRETTRITELLNLLTVIRVIFQKMISEDYLLTASIGFGNFVYKDLSTFSRIQKVPLYGECYLNVYLDNELGKPKLLPGLCRILKKDLPEEVLICICSEEKDESWEKLGTFEVNEDHIYYYWMSNKKNLPFFLKEYKRATEMPFLAYKKAIKKVLDS